MDFNSDSRSMCSVAVLLTIVACGQNTGERSSISKKKLSLTVSYDSIIFKTSSDEYIYLGRRLYPSSRSDSTSRSVDKKLVTIESVGDTVFAFFNSEMLYNEGNPKLPFVNDSLLADYYPKYYDVEIDDDIPYFAYLRSSKDYAQYIREETGEFYIETAILRDTVLNVLAEIKIGMGKADVLSVLGIPVELIDKDDFSLILCHANVPSTIWYKKDPKLKEAFTPKKSTIQVYLCFENGQLQFAYYDFWIGYGDRREVSF